MTFTEDFFERVINVQWGDGLAVEFGTERPDKVTGQLMVRSIHRDLGRAHNVIRVEVRSGIKS